MNSPKAIIMGQGVKAYRSQDFRFPSFPRRRESSQDFRFPSFPRRRESSKPLKSLDTRFRGYDEFTG
jgi:hypothetical protein